MSTTVAITSSTSIPALGPSRVVVASTISRSVTIACSVAFTIAFPILFTLFLAFLLTLLVLLDVFFYFATMFNGQQTSCFLFNSNLTNILNTIDLANYFVSFIVSLLVRRSVEANRCMACFSFYETDRRADATAVRFLSFGIFVLQNTLMNQNFTFPCRLYDGQFTWRYRC